MYWIIAVAVVCVAVYFVWASADIGSGVYLKTFCRGAHDAREVALTFDDGPSRNTEEVLDVLKEYGVRATFFLVGSRVESAPEIARRIVEEGHSVGNHTYSHRWSFPLRGGAGVTKELVRCNAAIERELGHTPIYFRPPYGVTNPIIGRAVRSLHLRAVGWSVRSFDTLSWRPKSKVKARVLKRLQNGAVILLHDGRDGSGKLVRELIEEIAARGYVFTTIDEMQKDESWC